MLIKQIYHPISAFALLPLQMSLSVSLVSLYLCFLSSVSLSLLLTLKTSKADTELNRSVLFIAGSR